MTNNPPNAWPPHVMEPPGCPAPRDCCAAALLVEFEELAKACITDDGEPQCPSYAALDRAWQVLRPHPDRKPKE